ncbi:MAG: LPS assembly protein LptD [Sulfuricaulis sp.]|nr:LPS assembly protein LptD [Sulfuricaulis sp.]
MPCHRLVRAALGLIVAWGAASNDPAHARDEAACPERPPRLPTSSRRITATSKDRPAEVYARELNSMQGGVSEFTGNVELRHEGQSLNAELLRHDKNSNQLDASGNVLFKDKTGLTYMTQEMHLNLDSRIGNTGSAQFKLEDGSARGDAERTDFEGPDHTRFTRVRYTTCAPGQDDWYLKITDLRLDTEEDIGTARQASIHFQGVPLIYLPYLSFPISDKRKSGFLIPRVGYASNSGGDISVPYYFNLAPDYDDTLTPELMTRRGLQLQNEFRYITRDSGGKLDFEILPQDRLKNGETRTAGTFQHRTLFNPYWSASVDVRGISDKEYFEDFRNDIGVTSQTHLPQNAQLDFRGPRWNFTARASDYQTIDRAIAPVDRPYARLPQLNLSSNRPTESNRINYSFDSELVSFSRDASINGERLILNPSVSFPLSNSYGFLTPRLGWQHIAYRLAHAPDETPTLTRTLFSLDSGLIFERDSLWGERLFTQTLEPRLYYLYVPSKNQDALPVFDTSLADFNFSNLFRNNRFVGGDRIGDANQITAAVTTRFIDESNGAERLRASLGKIYYFDDRQVNVPAATSSTGGSDIVAELSATLASHWHVRASAQRNPRDNLTQKYSYYLQYNPAKDRILNLGRRVSRDELQQTDISTQWPVATRWTFRARSLFSQEGNRNLESYAGVEYNACCWALRVLRRRVLTIDAISNTPSQKYSVMFELELTGLSKLGKVPDSPLRDSVFSPPSPDAKPLAP